MVGFEAEPLENIGAEIVGLDPNALTSAQWKRICNYQLMAFNGWEYIWLLRENDAIPDALAAAADSYYIGLIQTKPGLRLFWTEYKFAWVDPFLGYVDEVMRKESGRIESISAKSVSLSICLKLGHCGLC